MAKLISISHLFNNEYIIIIIIIIIVVIMPLPQKKP